MVCCLCIQADVTSIGLTGRDYRVTHGMELTFVPRPEPDPRPRLLCEQDGHSTGHGDASGVPLLVACCRPRLSRAPLLGAQSSRAAESLAVTCSWSGAKLKRQGPGPCCRAQGPAQTLRGKGVSRFVRRAPGAGSCARAGVWPLSCLASLPVPRAPCRFEISVSDSSRQPSA